MGTHDVNIRIGAKDAASKVFKRVAIAAATFLSFRAIGRFAQQSTKLFIEQEKSTIKLAAALKATGNAAGFTTKQLQAYASELQNVTVIGNESFESIMSVMATFRNVQGEIFKESILLTADVSQALGQDLQGAAIQLGKALNDPVVGLTALSRVGITFSQVQKDQIKAFQEVNDLASAQRIILDELSNQFGGQAKAQADSFGGSIQQLANAFGDLQEKIGQAIAELPGFRDAIDTTVLAVQNLGITWELVWLQMQRSILETSKRVSIFAIKIKSLLFGGADPIATIAAEARQTKAIEDFFDPAIVNLGIAIDKASDTLAAAFSRALSPPETPGVAGGAVGGIPFSVFTELYGNLFKDILGPGLQKIQGASRTGLAADESRFLTFGRQRQDDSRRAVVLAQRAERNRTRQLAATERIADALTGREAQAAQIAITAFR